MTWFTLGEQRVTRINICCQKLQCEQKKKKKTKKAKTPKKHPHEQEGNERIFIETKNVFLTL